MSIATQKIRITLVDNKDPDEAKVFLYPPGLDMGRFLQQATAKLGWSNGRTAQKLFLQDGGAIDDVESIREGDVVLVSSGEPFSKTKGLGLPKSEACPAYSIAVMGPGSVGKSAMTLRYVQGVFVRDYDPTIEDAYRKNAAIDDSPCILDILDTAGQEDYTALRSTWMRERDGFVLVYSVCDKGTFDGIQTFYEQLSAMHEDHMPPIVLVGNKCDLTDKRVVSTNEGKKLAENWGCVYVETSAKTGDNVDKTFATLVREMRQSISPQPQRGKKKSWCTIL